MIIKMLMISKTKIDISCLGGTFLMMLGQRVFGDAFISIRVVIGDH